MKIFFVFLMCAAIIGVIYGDEKPLLLVKVLRNCDFVTDDWAMIFKDITFKQLNKTTFVLNGHLSVRKQASAPITGYLSAQQCSDPNNPDSCELLVQDMETPDICELIKDETAGWSSFVDNLKIPHKCPIGPLEAEIVNYQVFNIFGDELPVPHGLYKLNFTGTMGENKAPFGCIYLEAII